MTAPSEPDYLHQIYSFPSSNAIVSVIVTPSTIVYT